ncbi:MAG: type II toxin-antitoxin system RelE/ParE family toxin [Burkholderiales bacterium]|nr:type II toxin-antitoxin system RelE/ParE family toxin [Burkholderiales bacterium]
MTVTVRHGVRLTAHFERNLAEMEAFLVEAPAPQAFDGLLDELLGTVLPNLERFPGMGRLFLERPARSVEVANGMARLSGQLGALAQGGELREYVMAHCLLLYAHIQGTATLLSIRHQRQLSFDFQALWPGH